MTFLTRLIAAAILATFAASSFVYAAGSGVMAAEMIASGATIKVMPDCDECGDADADGIGLACDFVCNAGSLTSALAPQQQDLVRAGFHLPATSVTRDVLSLTSPPAKQPPRTNL